MHKVETCLVGCYEINPIVRRDARGSFIKTYHENDYRDIGININVKEEYFSTSKKGVLRGLHFQLPPADHEKIVYCAYGEILDAVVDLRKKSPTYGKSLLTKLSSEKGNMLYIPKGFAHGFYVFSDIAVMMYKVSSMYSPEHDTGILWNSAGIDWPEDNPLISERDSKFVSLVDFDSPF